MANSSAGTILGHVWTILRTYGGGTDIPALQQEFLFTLLTQAVYEYERAFRRSGSEPIVFMKQTGFTLVADTQINQASVTTDDVSFVVDSSNDFELTDGAGVIWDESMSNVFNYTTNTIATETFSGVTNISFDHDEDDIVQRLYKLPTNFKTFRPANEYGDGVQVSGVPYYFMEGPPNTGFFSLYDDGTNKFLWLPRGVTGKAAVLYEKTSTVIDSTDDIIDVPPSHEFFLAWRMIQVASIPKEGAQPTQLYTVARSEGNKILKDILRDKDVGKYVRVRKFSLLRPTRDASFYQSVPR